MSPYDPDRQFNMSSLYRLEAANIPVVTVLKQTHTQLVAAAGIILTNHLKEKLADEDNKDEYLDIVIDQWQSGRSQLPPTWRSLYEVLRKINLDYLSQQIEEFFNSE